MKASIKFRDDQKPLLRAKIPINILSFPFQSSVSAGEPKELALSLSTFFDSGPSLKFSYRPNDPQKPFAFIFKTGVSHFGSPNKSPLLMSAEFNLIGTQNPSFLIHFKPNFGDFCLKKSHSSSGFAKKLGGDEGRTGYFNVDGLMRGMEFGAKTAVPLRDLATVNFRWGFRFPEVEDTASDMVVVGSKADVNRTGGFLGKNYNYRLPYLVMNKIGIEHGVAKEQVKRDDPMDKKLGEAYMDIKNQIDSIRSENMRLGNALNDLRLDLGAKKVEFSSDRKGNGDKNSTDVSGLGSESKDGMKL